MITTAYPSNDISPVDALWVLIQGQTKAVRAALTERLVEQQKDANVVDGDNSSELTKRIQAIENDPNGFFKLGGFMADSKSTAEELLNEAISEKYAI
jgi:hypothetical protein